MRISNVALTAGLALALALGSAGCKKEGSEAGGAAGPGGATVASNDALWGYAPADLTFGVVAGDGTLARIHAGLLTVLGGIEKAPGGAAVAAQVRSKMVVDGINLLDPAALTGIGI